jgi:hypothetical protein
MFPALSATPPTVLANSGAPDVQMAYRAPVAAPGGGTFDTTHTEAPTTDGQPPSQSPGTLMNGTIDSLTIGAYPAPVGGTAAAPSGVSAAAGPRGATVSWTDDSDPDSTNKIIDYVVMGSTGGTTFAGKNATSVFVQNLVPGQSYTFKVAARDAAGFGVFSAASNAVTPWNPDEPDVNKPGGLDPYWASEPIYHSDGTTVPGSWGHPVAPTAVACTGGSGAGKVNVGWTAPASGGPVTGYTVVLTDTTTHTTSSHSVSGTTLTYQFTGLTTGDSVTATVTATGALGTGVSAASAAFTVP